MRTKQIDLDRYIRDLVAYGTYNSTRTTSGTTFATGIDLLASPLSFIADGLSDYLVSVAVSTWVNNVVGAINHMVLNLDGLDAGRIIEQTQPTASYLMQCHSETPILIPSFGPHTVNVRQYCSAGSVTAYGSAGGVNTERPMLVKVERMVLR